MKKLKYNITNGSIYQHYSGKQYKIVCVAYYSGNDRLEEYVVYQGLYNDPKLGNNPIFTQPVERFLEQVTIDNVLQDRFTLINHRI